MEGKQCVDTLNDGAAAASWKSNREQYLWLYTRHLIAAIGATAVYWAERRLSSTRQEWRRVEFRGNFVRDSNLAFRSLVSDAHVCAKAGDLNEREGSRRFVLEIHENTLRTAKHSIIEKFFSTNPLRCCQFLVSTSNRWLFKYLRNLEPVWCQI